MVTPSSTTNGTPHKIQQALNDPQQKTKWISGQNTRTIFQILKTASNLEWNCEVIDSCCLEYIQVNISGNSKKFSGSSTVITMQIYP